MDLSRRDAAMRGGTSGPAIEPDKPEEGLLWENVESDLMPPKDPLDEAEKALLRRWLAEGAKWGTDPIDPDRFSTDRKAGRDWWSLQPLSRPAVPATERSIGPVDAFVLQRLAEAGWGHSPPADRRTLVRRLSFDLVGLPPTPDEVEAFIKDERPGAVERLVDRLLASPQFGVRWARLWLDLARYGESHGFEHDEFRPDAWRYRDWVVDALNANTPFDEFTRLQIAGDVLFPKDVRAVEATGFLVAGAYDSVGQTQQSEAMRRVVRQDELEDIVGTVGQTFLGTTIHCARCHDHKFDPIPQVDYYRLASALDGVRHGVRDLSAIDPEALAARRHIDAILVRLDELEGPVRARLKAETRLGDLPEPWLRWDFRDAGLTDRPFELRGAAKLTPEGLRLDGKTAYAISAPIDRDLKAKTLEAWVQLDDLEQRGGGVLSLQTPDGAAFDAIVFGEREAGRWMAGSEGFRRWRSFEGDLESLAKDRPVHLAITYAEDGTITGYRDGQPYGKAYRSDDVRTFSTGQARFLFGLRHGEVGGNRLLAGTIVRAAVHDRALSLDEVSASARSGGLFDARAIAEALPEDVRAEWQELRNEINRVRARMRDGPRRAYAVTPSAAGVTKRLERGDTRSPSEDVAPGGLSALAGLPADFGLPTNAPDSDRRRALAVWISDARNPLFARVIVNRVWHWHFGVGLVETPNDVGFEGGRPSHPALLDWLATDLIEHGWDLKHLHGRIVLSSTYQQASRLRPKEARGDAANRLLWRKAPMRLEAEMVRDAMLAVSGRLDPALGGPGFREFSVTKAPGTTTNRYTPVDPLAPGNDRRTLFRSWARGGRSGFLDAFDCPDPSTIAPARAASNTPLQALAMLNDSIALDLSVSFAERVEREAGPDAGSQVYLAYRLAFGRDPDERERALATPLVAAQGLRVLTRALFNANEFLFID